MMKNFPDSPSPLVIPLEVLGAANGFLPQQANRFPMPFVSIDTSRVTGNTSQPIFVPVIAAGQNHLAAEVAQFIAREIAKRYGVETADQFWHQ